jgi:hypothetical protein
MGVGLALMDELLKCRYFFDVDTVKDSWVDWESLGVYLSHRTSLTAIVFAGWFSISDPTVFKLLESVTTLPWVNYESGIETLHAFIERAQIVLQSLGS